MITESYIKESNGQLHCLTVTKLVLKVWYLEDYVKYKWKLKYSKPIWELGEKDRSYVHNLLETVRDLSSQIDPLVFKDGYLLMMVDVKVYICQIETKLVIE